MTTADGLAHLEREHGLTGTLRVAPGVQRVRAQLPAPPRDRSGAHAPRAGSRRWKSPRRTTRPRHARRCCVGTSRRSGPCRAATSAWAMMHVPEIGRSTGSSRCAVSATSTAASSSTSRAPLPDPDLPAPVRFLPKWDNVLLGFADRTRVLPERHRKTVIRMNGDVAQTVDGFVAGISASRAAVSCPSRSSSSLGTTRGRGRGGTASVPRRLTSWSRQSVEQNRVQRRSSWRPIACCCGGSLRTTSTTSSSSTAMPTMHFVTGGRPTPRRRSRAGPAGVPRLLRRFDGYGFWAAIEKSGGRFLGWFHFRPARRCSPGRGRARPPRRKSLGEGCTGSRARRQGLRRARRPASRRVHDGRARRLATRHGESGPALRADVPPALARPYSRATSTATSSMRCSVRVGAGPRASLGGAKPGNDRGQ